jgi:branched-chain amino acid aminotransferase
MKEIVYLNGKLIPRDKAYLSIGDHGFLYSFGIFQSMRAYNGKLFLLDEHIKRLHDGTKLIGLEHKLAGIDFAKICRDTLAANELKSARVRVTVTNGDNEAMPWVDPSGPPTIIGTAHPYTPMPEEKYQKGYKLGIASLRRMKQSPLSTIKSTSYLLNVVARMEGVQKGFDEIIMLNEEGYVAEGGGGNLFFVEGERLLTPSADNGLIPGVTREAVMGIAVGMGINVTEGDISPDAIKGFDEVFMTNAMIEVMPVTRVGDDAIADGKPGEMTRRLLEAYREKVMRETG